MAKFKALVNKFEEGLWTYHFLVPEKIYKQLTATGNKRIVCSINDNAFFHDGFMPDGKGQWFIKLNKEKMLQFQLQIGQEVQVQIESDTSKYGMPLPQEFEEVLTQDIEGTNFFEKLTAGKKRNLIYIISSVKNSDTRITKTLIIMDHLKANKGHLDFKMLHEALKNNSSF